MRADLKACILATILIGSVIGCVSSYAAYATRPTTEATKAAPSAVATATSQAVAGTNTSQATTGGTPTPSTPAAVRRTTPAPNCTPATLMQPVAAPNISLATPGVTESPLVRNEYTIYGNTLNEIRTQSAACAPVMSNGERFSANTSYALNWTFSYQDNGSGVCSVRSAAVGLAIGQQYPAWQASAGVNPGVSGAWQTFMQNLTTHENEHANLARTYASQILNRIQNFPPTSCSSIVAAVNGQARAVIGSLDAANEAYDHDTNHGTTQGAIL